VRAPFFSYSHPFTPGYDGHLFPGDACDPANGSAVAGLSFYDATGIDPESAFPDELDGALFFTDASRGCIWTMREGVDGGPDPATIENFWVHQSSDSLFTPVDITEGADGALYVPNFYFDQIVQIRYFPGNQAPTVHLTADKTFGELPLKVKLDASTSSDPDPGDHLNFAWDLDGDGEFDDGINAKAEPTYTEAKNVTPKVRVSDDFNHTEVLSVALYPGDKGPPQVTIEKPEADLKWAVGETLEYEASATDPDGDSFGSVSQPLTPHWEFILKHCPSACHDHPLTSSDSPSGSFVLPAHEYPSHLRLDFTATDSRGMSTTKSVEVFPRLVEVGVDSDPPGIPVTLGDLTEVGPFKATTIAGNSISVAAPATATVDGEPLVFSSWSDDGERVHDVTALESRDLVAHFKPKPEDPPPVDPGSEKPTSQPPAGGGSSAGSPPPAVGSARLQLASRPAGVRLRLGEVQAETPFSAELALGTETFVIAPRAIRRHGKRLGFQKWVLAGRSLGSARRQPLTVAAAARYLAVYGRR
jgi:hypothetical protein